MPGVAAEPREHRGDVADEVDRAISAVMPADRHRHARRSCPPSATRQASPCRRPWAGPGRRARPRRRRPRARLDHAGSRRSCRPWSSLAGDEELGVVEPVRQLDRRRLDVERRDRRRPWGASRSRPAPRGWPTRSAARRRSARSASGDRGELLRDLRRSSALISRTMPSPPAAATACRRAERDGVDAALRRSASASQLHAVRVILRPASAFSSAERVAGDLLA